jgi:hypothetical protein
MLRAYSDGLRPLVEGRSFSYGLILPELLAGYNSRLPIGPNDGSLRPGRGWNVQLLGGGYVHDGPLTVLIAPELDYEANGLGPMLPDSLGGDSVSVPWYRGSVDLPVRFGSGSSTRLLPGQSSAWLDAGPVSAGVSTENEWWGPGLLNALVLSSNAAGFPHLFVRTARPIRLGVGTVEGRLLAGELRGSGYFAEPDSTIRRSVSAAAIVFRPAGADGLSVGVARSVYGPTDDAGQAAGRFAEALTRWWTPDSMASAEDQPGRGQILSLFGRWAFPADGLELYGEWARTHLPTSIGDFLQAPGYSQGYTLGFQWLHPLTGAADLRVQSEATFLERSSRTGPRESFYASAQVPGGYTNEGESLGAVVGPGGSSQWLAADYLVSTARVGAFVGRTRWNEDAYLTRTSPWPFLGHDVSVYGGIRGSYLLRGMRLEGTLSRGTRMNYLYQNWSKSWGAASKDAVNISNLRFETRFSYVGVPSAPRLAPLTPAPVSPTPRTAPDSP